MILAFCYFMLLSCGYAHSPFVNRLHLAPPLISINYSMMTHRLNESYGCPIVRPDPRYIHTLLLTYLPNHWTVELIPIIVDYYMPRIAQHLVAIDRNNDAIRPLGYMTTSHDLTDNTKGVTSATTGIGTPVPSIGRGWHRLNLPSPFISVFGVGHINNHIYIVGRNDAYDNGFHIVSCSLSTLAAQVEGGSPSTKSSIEWCSYHPRAHYHSPQLPVFRSLIWRQRLILYDSQRFTRDPQSNVRYFDTNTNTWHVVAPTRDISDNSSLRMVIYRDRLLCYWSDRLRRPDDTYPIDYYNEQANTWLPFTDITYPYPSTKMLTMCIPINRLSSRPSSSLSSSSTMGNEELYLIWDLFEHTQSYCEPSTSASHSSSVPSLTLPPTRNMGKWCIPKWIGTDREVMVLDNDWLLFVPSGADFSPPHAKTPFGIVHIDDVVMNETAWRWYDAPPITSYHHMIIFSSN
jgi:hypothetical protein